jgi:hypothetical protein
MWSDPPPYAQTSGALVEHPPVTRPKREFGLRPTVRTNRRRLGRKPSVTKPTRAGIPRRGAPTSSTAPGVRIHPWGPILARNQKGLARLSLRGREAL